MRLEKDHRVSFYENRNQSSNVYSYEEESPTMRLLKTGINRLGEAFKSPTLKVFSRNYDNGAGWKHDHEPWWKTTLDPSSEAVLSWNRIFLVACLVALFVDPLFFYLPLVDITENSTCVTRSVPLGVVVTFFRTFADIFYMLHVVVKFRTAFVAPSSRVFGRGELVRNKKLIARRYIRSGFFIDFIAALPLPQIVIWFIIPAIRLSRARSTYNALQLIVFLQYIPRLYQIYPLSSEIIKAAGVVTKTAWAGAAYNLLLYMLASHVLGAAWYLLSVERYSSCWKTMCQKEDSPIKCRLRYLDCSTLNDEDRINWANRTQVFSKCDAHHGSNTFDYGIFENAMLKDVVSKSFIHKYLYCLWWGLQQLSSYGQELDASTFILETSFCIVIAVMGLVLFAHLIGNMQTYLESITSRLEEWRIRKRDTEEWMQHRQLPEPLQQRVRQFVQYKWLATRGVNEEAILSSLPTDLRRDIQRHLCLYLVRRVPFFAQMDNQLLDAICERLTSSLSTSNTIIVREGDPVTEMLFIISGTLDSSTTNGGQSGFFNSITLKPGDFCGEELLAWALLPNAANLPSSTRTVKAREEVEAFALQAEDLKFVANQFRRLHSKKLQHTFRYHSHSWRAWAACFIQAAWRRCVKRKMGKSLSSRESLIYESSSSFSSREEYEHVVGYETHDHHQLARDEDNEETMIGGSIGVLARRFVTNTRKGSQKKSDVELPKLVKPQDPDFSMDSDFP